MHKTLKPFVVLSTYAVLFALTYSFLCAVISLTFWVNYLEVAQNFFSVGVFIVGAGVSLCLAVVNTLESKNNNN